MRRLATGLGVGLLWLIDAALVVGTIRWAQPLDLWVGVEWVARVGGAILVVVAAAFGVNRLRLAMVATVVAALGWQGALFQSSGESPANLRSAGMFASAFTFTALGLIVGSRRARWLWCIPAIAGLVWAATYDPFRDPDCTTFCATNQLLLHWSPHVAASAFDVQHIATLALGIAGAVLAWRSHSRARAVLGAALAIAAASSWLRVHGHHGATTLGSIAVIALAMVTLVPIRRAVTRSVRLVRLRRLARATAAGHGRSLQDGLRAALADPTLRIAYPTEGGTFVDASGGEYSVGNGRAVTTLVIRDHTVAIIDHQSTINTDDVRDAFGPAARMAAWNEGLAANLRHRLAEVTASRRRLIDAGDRERRSLERDLHDGIQQSLLALLFELRHAERAATGEDRDDLTRCVDLVAEALVSTRRLANGVFPAMVDRAGLASVLNTLAEHGERPVQIDADEVRLSPAIARTVHDTVAATVARVTDEPAGVTATVDGERLTLRVTAPGALPPPDVEDRIAALGGTCQATEAMWTVELPCGS